MVVDMNNEKGQAIFEFIVFLPMVLILCGLLVVTGNSINASINQQKATRSYFFQFIQNDSRLPNKRILTRWGTSVGLRKVGHFSLGWTEKLEGSTPFTACFRYNAMFGDIKPDETCDEPDIEENKSSYIRPATAFGVCGDSYVAEPLQGSGAQFRPNWWVVDGRVQRIEDCVNAQ